MDRKIICVLRKDKLFQKILFFTMIGILILLILPTVFQSVSIPDNLIDSTVGITALNSNGEIYSGTGFPIGVSSDKTYLATCDHIVDNGYDRVLVSYGDALFSATTVCSDPLNDIAIVSVNTILDCNPLPISEAGIGSRVYSAGFPEDTAAVSALYNDNSKVVTTGNVRSFIGLFEETNIIVYDAPGGEGMSGGPVVNCNGDVVGIVAFSYDDYEGVMGAACGADLINLCKENNIPYSHKISIRLVRDCIFSALLLTVVFILIFKVIKKYVLKY